MPTFAAVATRGRIVDRAWGNAGQFGVSREARSPAIFSARKTLGRKAETAFPLPVLIWARMAIEQ